ncbi:MAG: hypothetical protein M1489_06845 [Firmicutes bacterium]|nr:hypothetical protein [Bacillota bacterium]
MKKVKTMKVSQAECELLQMFRGFGVSEQIIFESILNNKIASFKDYLDSQKKDAFYKNAVIKLALFEEFAKRFHDLYKL